MPRHGSRGPRAFSICIDTAQCVNNRLPGRLYAPEMTYRRF